MRQPPAGFVIRPQMGKRKPPEAAAAPAYLKAPAAPAAAPAPGRPGAAGQKSWPPSLRAYVERAFTSCASAGERAALQAALKLVRAAAEGQSCGSARRALTASPCTRRPPRRTWRRAGPAPGCSGAAASPALRRSREAAGRPAPERAGRLLSAPGVRARRSSTTQRARARCVRAPGTRCRCRWRWAPRPRPRPRPLPRRRRASRRCPGRRPRPRAPAGARLRSAAAPRARRRAAPAGARSEPRPSLALQRTERYSSGTPVSAPRAERREACRDRPAGRIRCRALTGGRGARRRGKQASRAAEHRARKRARYSPSPSSSSTSSSGRSGGSGRSRSAERGRRERRAGRFGSGLAAGAAGAGGKVPPRWRPLPPRRGARAQGRAPRGGGAL